MDSWLRLQWDFNFLNSKWKNKNMKSKKWKSISFWISLGILLFVSTSTFAKVFESKTEALKSIFGASGTFKKITLQLNQEQKNYLEKKLGHAIKRENFTFYLAKKNSQIKGYATVVSEFGRDGYNKLLVVITPTGKIDVVKVLESRDSKGKEITQKRFLRQFEGKSNQNNLDINQDIATITGATISAKAAIKAVKKALVIWKLFFRKNNNNL